MKIDRPTFDQANAGGLRQGWSRFWFSAIEASQLHRLRVLAGLLFFGWILSYAGHQGALFSLQGWFDREAYQQLSRQELRIDAPAPISWSIFYMAHGDDKLFDLLYCGSLIIVGLFTLGVAPRITAILTWVIVVSVTANPTTSYDADFLMVILAFYLMIGYALMGQWQGDRSVLERILGPNDSFILGGLWRSERQAAPRSYAANFALRLFQVHFALILVASGLAKLQIPDWWAGVAYWYPLHPPFQTTKDSYMSEMRTAPVILGLLGLAQYGALAWQIGFPAFAWRGGRWRVVLIGGGVIGLLGSFFLLGLPLFGPFYLIGCLSFLTADEWRALRSRFGGRGADAAARPMRAVADPHKIKVGVK